MLVTKPKDKALITEGFWYEPLEYDVSNKKVIGQFDGNIGISKYSVAGEWVIVTEKSWFTAWSVNGKRLSSRRTKKVSTLGRLMNITFDSGEELDSVEVSVNQYCNDNDNAMYIQMRFENKGDQPADVFVRHGMNWDLASYMSSMVKTYGRYESMEMKGSWNESHTSWEAELGKDYFVHLASSHPAIQIEQEGPRMVLDFKDHLEPGKSAFITISISGGTSPLPINELMDKRNTTYHQAVDYSRWLQELFTSENNLLNSMFASCVNVSNSSYKESGEEFAAFYAGVNYQSPSRTYFRDGYWTILPILPFKPEWVRNEILTLAYGIDEDGSCPSAVIYNFLQNKFEQFWPDHFDSPSFFVMMIHDYLAWTHDTDLLVVEVKGRTVLDLVNACIGKLERYTDLELNQLNKPENRRDWCDNVVRQGLVTYDVLLHIRARSCFAEILRFIGEGKKAEKIMKSTVPMVEALKEQLWKGGGYANYVNTSENGVSENNVSIEQALAAVFNIGSDKDQEQLLDLLTDILETKNNADQPFGDWGVMTVYPSYTHTKHLVEKSSYPFRYHSGSDWPYLSGVYAWAKLTRNRDDWEYPLTRWFTYSIERQWLTPVEYFDPVFGKGSYLQGWSAMPAAAMLYGGLGLTPQLNGDFELKIPKWGNTLVKGISYRGKKYTYCARDGELSFKEE
ncbi:hypothetical protein ACFFHF_10990 [Robertmurraya beringensis]|uniref:Uncharacterized protein n=1 Tax=Robertmurraya beringensis TaxID=641660 RepID=A0ABV6KV55_9BACI